MGAVGGMARRGTVINRALRHGHLVNIRGNSYRMRECAELYRALQREAHTTETVRRARRPRSTGH